jgi:rod shape-determining protein MreB and related proteins
MDLGSAGVVIATDEQGILLQQSTTGEEEGSFSHISPSVGFAAIEHGLIADEKKLRTLLVQWRKSLHVSFIADLFPKPVVIAVPSTMDQMHAQFLGNTLRSAGFTSPVLVPSLSCIYEMIGLTRKNDYALIIDMGAGKTDVGIVCPQGVENSSSCKEGGFTIDEQIQQHILDQFGVSVALQDIQSIKTQFDFGSSKENVFVVRGKDMRSGMLTSVRVGEQHIAPLFAQYIDTVVRCVEDLLYKTPPDILEKVLRQGVYLAGGLSQIAGIEKQFSTQLTMPVHSVARPKLAVTLGCCKIAKHPDRMRQCAVHFDD